MGQSGSRSASDAPPQSAAPPPRSRPTISRPLSRNLRSRFSRSLAADRSGASNDPPRVYPSAPIPNGVSTPLEEEPGFPASGLNSRNSSSFGLSINTPPRGFSLNLSSLRLSSHTSSQGLNDDTSPPGFSEHSFSLPPQEHPPLSPLGDFGDFPPTRHTSSTEASNAEPPPPTSEFLDFLTAFNIDMNGEQNSRATLSSLPPPPPPAPVLHHRSPFAALVDPLPSNRDFSLLMQTDFLSYLLEIASLTTAWSLVPLTTASPNVYRGRRIDNQNRAPTAVDDSNFGEFLGSLRLGLLRRELLQDPVANATFFRAFRFDQEEEPLVANEVPVMIVGVRSVESDTDTEAREQPTELFSRQARENARREAARQTREETPLVPVAESAPPRGRSGRGFADGLGEETQPRTGHPERFNNRFGNRSGSQGANPWSSTAAEGSPLDREGTGEGMPLGDDLESTRFRDASPADRGRRSPAPFPGGSSNSPTTHSLHSLESLNEVLDHFLDDLPHDRPFRSLAGSIRNAYERAHQRRRARLTVAPLELQQRTWVIYVIGNMYPAMHPILTSPLLMSDNPTYEDLLHLSELIGNHVKDVVEADEVESAGGETILTVGATPCSGTTVVLEGDQCLICLEEYVTGDTGRVLTECEHVFHRQCIDMWLMKGKNSCPLCRKKSVSKPLSEHVDESALVTQEGLLHGHG